jgi:hypothetical protein
MSYQWSPMYYNYTDSRTENKNNKNNSQLTRQFDEAKNLTNVVFTKEKF